MRVIEFNPCENGKGAGGYSPAKAYRWLASIVAALVALDQATKLIALRFLEPYGTISTPLGGLLRFTLVFNDGAAFGILSGRRWLMLAITVATVLAAVLFWKGIWSMGLLVRGAAAVVLAGSLGNFIDRVRIGHVIDFIEVPLVPLFQVFNFADAFLVLGSLVLIYAIFRAS